MNQSLSKTLQRGITSFGIAALLLSSTHVYAESSPNIYSKDRAKLTAAEKKVVKQENANALQFHYSLGKDRVELVKPIAATDCTASFGIDKASLKDYFGLEIVDNCSEVNLNVQVESCVPKVVYGIVVEGATWRSVSYSTMRVNSRLMVVGVPIGKHRLLVTATDGCGNQKVDTLNFVIADKVAPVMKCTDELNVALANTQSNPYGQNVPTQGYDITGYAKVNVAEIDAGSWDNCGMDWIRARRSYNAQDERAYVALGYDWNKDGKITLDGADGVDWNNDGDILDDLERFEQSKVDPNVWMTPALDYVEFFCNDRGTDGVMIELWGKDKITVFGNDCQLDPVGGVAFPTTSGGNLNYCWQKIILEDNTAPTFVAPTSGARIFCTDRAMLDSLQTPRTINLYSSTYTFIESQILDAQQQGRFTIMSGDDCQDLPVQVEIVPNLIGEAGMVRLIYTAQKLVKGKLVTFRAGFTDIQVHAVHAYSIVFPADKSGSCQDIRDTANVIDGGELGCDVLAVHISDKRYNGAIVNGEPVAECYKIFRTFTVINWNQYDDRCGEPMQWAVIVPRNPDGVDNASDGVNVLVRDVDRDGVEEIYFEDGVNVAAQRDGKNFIAQPGERVTNATVPTYNNGRAGFAYNNAANQPCAFIDEKFAWMYTQHIFVHDASAPEINDPGSLVFIQDKNTCVADVRISISASDECAPVEVQQAPAAAQNLALERVRIKVNGAPAQELGSLATITPNHALNGDDKGGINWIFRAASMPVGNHSLLVVVRDDCGNLSAQREIPFSVVDTTGPVPICHHGLMTELTKNPVTASGEVTVWASDLVASPIDDCSGQGPTTGPTQKPLIRNYYLVKDNGDRIWDAQDGLDARGYPTNKSDRLTLTCDDAQFTQILVRLYAEDQAGNMGFCETYIIVSDPLNTCTQGFPSQISGVVSTESGAMVDQVEVRLSGGASMMYMTDASGKFDFKGLVDGSNYVVTPHRDYDFMNGVSTFDLTLLSRHILGIQEIKGPYKLIAADINNSGTISTADVLALRKMILGLDAEFPNNRSWRFIDASFTFPDPQNPWLTPFPEVIHCKEVHGMMQVGFIGVKIGDISGNSNATSTLRSEGTLALQFTKEVLEEGAIYRLPLRSNLKNTEGFQFTLDTRQLELLAIEPGIIEERQVGVFADQNAFTVSWEKNPRFIESDTMQQLLTLVVRAKVSTTTEEALQLNSRITRVEAFTKQGDPQKVQLEFNALPFVESVVPGFELLQNVPNPFESETVIGFRMPQAGEATLVIQDVAGRTLYTTSGAYSAGYNQIRIHNREQGLGSSEQASGILYYTLTSGTFSASKKMIHIKTAH